MPDTLLCRFQNAKAFQVFVDALRSFVGEKVDYLLVESTPEGNVVGFACDGPRFAKQVYDPDENAVTIYRPFSVYLRPVSITNVDNVSVTLFEDADGNAVLRYGDTVTKCKRPETPADFHTFYKKAREITVCDLDINRNLLEETLRTFDDDTKNKRVNISVRRCGNKQMFSMRLGKNERYICPIIVKQKPKKEPDNTDD